MTASSEPHLLTAAVQPYAMPAPPNHLYGVQRRAAFVAGTAKAVQLLEGGQCRLLWRVTAHGTNCTFTLSWGTYANHQLTGLRSPFVGNIPGAFTLQAVPIDPDLALDAVGALSVASGGFTIARAFASVAGDLGPYAARVIALNAAVVEQNGINVPIAQGSSLDVAGPASLVSGSVIVEYAL